MKPILFGTALVLLTACDPSAADRTAEIEQADSQAAAAPHAPALTAAGDPMPLEADPDD